MSNFPSDIVVPPQLKPDGIGWRQRRFDDVHVIYLAGELDLATAAQLRQLLTGVVESSTAAAIVLDLSGVDFIDAVSVRMIVAAWRVEASRGRQLQVVGLHGVAGMIFDALELEPLVARTMDHRTMASGGGRAAR